MSVTVGTAIPPGQSWTIFNCTGAVVTSKPAWLTTSVSTAGNDCIVALSGTPDTSVASFTVGATATNNNVPAGCTPTATAGVTSASVTVNCQTPTIGATLAPTNATVGVAYSATITVTNATTASVTNLPAWLSQSFAAGTITLTGTPAAGDVTAGLALTVDATNACGATSASATNLAGGTVIVSAGVPACTTPTIGAALSPTTATVGSAYTATIVVNNATTASVTNLPGWLSQSYAQSGANGTITLTGTPAAGDVTAGLALLVDATNAAAGCTSTSATGLAGGTLVVGSLPACTAPTIGAALSPSSATVGSAFSATITVNNATTGVSVTNLPGWLSASVTYSAPNATITLTGTPAAGDVTAGLALLVDATNNPGGCTSSNATGLAGGTLVVGSLPACTTPTISATLNPTTATVGTAFSATINISNSTTATVTNRPAWLSESYSQSGANGVLTLSGTPAAGDVTAGLALLVNATNNPGGCTSSSATGLAGGTLIVNAASAGQLVNFQGTYERAGAGGGGGGAATAQLSFGFSGGDTIFSCFESPGPGGSGQNCLMQPSYIWCAWFAVPSIPPNLCETGTAPTGGASAYEWRATVTSFFISAAAGDQAQCYINNVVVTAIGQTTGWVNMGVSATAATVEAIYNAGGVNCTADLTVDIEVREVANPANSIGPVSIRMTALADNT